MKNRAYYRQHDRGRYYFCGRFYPVCKGGTARRKTSTAERKVLFWYDPMYPNTRFDKPEIAVYGYGSGAEICR